MFVVEGEKDVNTLRAQNVRRPATRWAPANGATTSPIFRDADVVICPDNDQPGRDHAGDVARKLSGVARRVRMLDLQAFWPEIEESDDVSDWFAAGGTVKQLWEIVEGLPAWRDGANSQRPRQGDRKPRARSAAADQARPKANQHLGA